jgi:uncharacterized protein YcbX
MPIEIVDIRRYPVKGLSAERLEEVVLSPARGLPHDRRFAVAHGTTDFDPKRPAWLHKSNFLTLLRDEKLALLRTRFDDRSGVLTIERNGETVLRADVAEHKGRAEVGRFFADFMAGDVRGAPKVVEADGHMFTDSRRDHEAGRHWYVSIVNAASVRALERFADGPIDPVRFRANVYIDGAPAWAEFGWAGREVAVGDARLRVARPIERCAATNVNPSTAERDLNLPLALKRGFGHVNMGVYAVVTAGGAVAIGDELDASCAPATAIG